MNCRSTACAENVKGKKRGDSVPVKDLTQMKPGEKANVADIRGGHGMVRRLEALGIRPGVTITKVSAQFMRGPVIIRVGNTQIAIGFGMARHVLVETTNKSE